ncbi:MAG: glycosyltransferase family 4 protein [Nitrospiraceae bacterium]|nr:glycosyltransferase family 4 protein [Nitrospira sp.]MCB9775688.1 glycosyltransferase family 4 protein [Nitrospiraceae bacterium]
MEILYHHRTQLGDAQGVHVHEIIKAFRELGHQVRVVGLVNYQSLNSKSAATGLWGLLRKKVPHFIYDLMSLGYNVIGIFMLARSVIHERPDFIYERYALNNFSGVVVSRLWKIPIIVEVNAPLYVEQAELGQLAIKWVARILEKWICSHATQALAVSGVLKEILVSQGVPSHKITVMPNGIDFGNFNPDVSGVEVRKQYGLKDSVVIGFVGWFRPWHGVEMLLDILQDLLSANKDVKFLMIGDGPIYDELVQKAKDLGIWDAVRFTGSLPHEKIPSYIAAMDIAVQPRAPRYACPMKVLEYMGMGKCIVAPFQPNICEVLEDKISGFLFLPEDKNNLRQVMLTLINNKKLQEETGMQAFSAVQSRKLSWKGNAEKVIILVSQGKEYCS